MIDINRKELRDTLGSFVASVVASGEDVTGDGGNMQVVAVGFAIGYFFAESSLGEPAASQGRLDEIMHTVAETMAEAIDAALTRGGPKAN